MENEHILESSDEDQIADNIYDDNSEGSNVNINLSCPICRYDYNSTNRKVYVISSCGHSFCNHCINKITVCSICRKPIQSKNINWFIQSQIDEMPDELSSIDDIRV